MHGGLSSLTKKSGKEMQERGGGRHRSTLKPTGGCGLEGRGHGRGKNGKSWRRYIVGAAEQETAERVLVGRIRANQERCRRMDRIFPARLGIGNEEPKEVERTLDPG